MVESFKPSVRLCSEDRVAIDPLSVCNRETVDGLVSGSSPDESVTSDDEKRGSEGDENRGSEGDEVCEETFASSLW